MSGASRGFGVGGPGPGHQRGLEGGQGTRRQRPADPNPADLTAPPRGGGRREARALGGRFFIGFAVSPRRQNWSLDNREERQTVPETEFHPCWDGMGYYSIYYAYNFGLGMRIARIITRTPDSLGLPAGREGPNWAAASNWHPSERMNTHQQCKHA